MFFSRWIVRTTIIFSVLLISACGDLDPSDTDMRPPVIAGTGGVQVTQQAIDFVVSDTLNLDVSLSAEYPVVDAVVLYFTMWCPVCDSHMSYMRNYIVPNYPNVSFYFVDYVTGSVTASRQAQVSNGYTDFRVLVDTDNWVQETYHATMGTVVVIDSNGIVQMNEDFKDGSKLTESLESL